MTTSSTTAVGVFDSREMAERAVDELRRAGFKDAQIRIGARADKQTDSRPSGPPTWESGAGIGGMTGAALGGLVAGLPGLAAGAVAGLLLGAMIDLGIPEEDARWYAAEVEAGRFVVAVAAADRKSEAQEILTRQGAREATKPASP